MRRRLPVLLVAATLCGAGIMRAWSQGWSGALLAGAGLVLVGAWLAGELIERNTEKIEAVTEHVDRGED
jgi:hypothetical protein